MARLHVWQIQAVRDALLIMALFGLVWAGYAMRTVTVPLLIALTLAYLFEPLVSLITRRYQVSRTMAVSGLLLSVGLAVVVLLAILIPLVIGETTQLVRDARAGRFQKSFLRLQEFVPEDFRDEYQSTIAWMVPGADSTHQNQPAATQIDFPTSTTDQRSTQALDDNRVREIVRQELALGNAASAGDGETLWDWAKRGMKAVFNFIGAAIAFGLVLFLIPFYFFFFSVSYPRVVQFGKTLIPAANRARTLELFAKMDRAVAGFVRGRIVICVIMGVMLAVGWWVCKVPYAVLLGFIIGAFSIVPYLGGIGIPLAVGLLALDQMNTPADQRMAWWAVILWPCVVFGIVQVVETYILTPTIAGKATNLDPVTILVAVLAGGSVGGVYGMILAIPVAACLKILFTDVLLPRIRAWTKGEIEDPLPI